MPQYHVVTFDGALPPTKTYPKDGQRTYWVKAPGVLGADADGEAVETCTFDVKLEQKKGNKVDAETYHVWELSALDVRNLPRSLDGHPAGGGYVFHCFTREPTQETPGVYRVATGPTGRAYWCECLGAKGHQQTSQCKHRDLITALAERSPAEPTPQENGREQPDRRQPAARRSDRRSPPSRRASR